MERDAMENTNLSSLRLLDPGEVAETLNVSKGFVYKMVKLGQLPAVRIGSAIRVSQNDLMKFLIENKTSK